MHFRNLDEARPTFVTHLECSATGERYEADRPHGLSAAGKPLITNQPSGRSSEVERQLPKLNVGGSIPPTRSKYPEQIK